jgi:hypothetical protein
MRASEGIRRPHQEPHQGQCSHQGATSEAIRSDIRAPSEATSGHIQTGGAHQSRYRRTQRPLQSTSEHHQSASGYIRSGQSEAEQYQSRTKSGASHQRHGGAASEHIQSMPRSGQAVRQNTRVVSHQSVEATSGTVTVHKQATSGASPMMPSEHIRDDPGPPGYPGQTKPDRLHQSASAVQRGPAVF